MLHLRPYILRAVRATRPSGTTVVGAYEYDGLNRRISKTVSGTVRHFYYSAAWQVLEERVGASTSAESQQVFGPRYVDELILRDRDTDANGSLNERLYYLQDANFNVTTLVNTAGDAQERYIYEPYGEVDVFTGSWGSRGPSSYANRYMFTGREYDSETGLFHFRMRDYHAQVGRFVNRDPIEYGGSAWNLYEYTDSMPLIATDAFGLGPCGIPDHVDWNSEDALREYLKTLTPEERRRIRDCLKRLFPDIYKKWIKGKNSPGYET